MLYDLRKCSLLSLQQDVGDPLDPVGSRGPPRRRPPLLLGSRGGGVQEELKGESYFPEFNNRKTSLCFICPEN